MKWKMFKDHLKRIKKDVKEIQEELERIIERYE
jgi:archaellum component FlaC